MSLLIRGNEIVTQNHLYSVIFTTTELPSFLKKIHVCVLYVFQMYVVAILTFTLSFDSFLVESLQTFPNLFHPPILTPLIFCSANAK